MSKVNAYGLIPSLIGNKKCIQDVDYSIYDQKMVKKYYKKKASETEIVHAMFRNSKSYAESMKKKDYRIMAAICILNKVEYIGCDIWNDRIADAMKYFKYNKGIRLTEQDIITN